VVRLGQIYEPVLRFLIDPIYNTYMLQPNLGLENLQIFVQIYEPVLRFLIDPISITYMLQPNLGLESIQILCKYMSLY
jgi:hypothetical protein